jgi:tetratricopeptide (TPR) repeat protein/energy-coupling factor transporter ATP-binding protein EcfA2
MSGSPVADQPVESGRLKAPGPSDATLSASRPFPGLRPFTFADRRFFFGRESQVFALYRLVENGRFIAVIGSSGSGKSSLVLAGLWGLLDEETNDPNGPKWICLDMKPGGAPIKRLAGALARLSAHTSAENYARLSARIDYRLRQSSFSLESALEEAGGLGGRHLLLIVDQFEELFRFGLAGLGQRATSLADAKARDEATQFVEILLDADRRRVQNVHVLITMRSDFIGDCAYFHGLSEAVSATQYLVPNLTRGQLEEAIRQPIEEAGGAIEPELVERLLNDCGDELDQLPVLQHCLMRLWDRASTETPAGGVRRLTRQTYDAIGRMTEALSRHADEILDECAGKELAVEQAFRALSEVDREGRTIRRAIRFDRLLAETGVSEPDLRAVLDRFRASNCSFLFPSLSASPTLAPDERIDIGHEALLRRWKRIAGKTEPVDPKTGRPPPGWLGEEQNDGQRYHWLVSLLNGDAGGERATLVDPERTKEWWEHRPRTEAWADRYGGKFESVKKLIDDAIETKKRSRRNRQLSAALGIIAAVGGALWVWVAHESAQQRAIALEKLRLEDIDKNSMKSAKTLLEDVLHAYNDKSLDLAGAESLATISGQFLDEARAAGKTSAADIIWAQALNVDADLQSTLNKDAEALALARKAKEAALSVIQTDPNAPQPLQVQYDASIRVGNALSALAWARHQDALRRDALEEYNAAIAVAAKIALLSGDDRGDDDVIDAHMKIGDIYKDSKQHPQALAEYQAGLKTCEAAIIKHPDSFDLFRNKGKAFFRIAELLRKDTALDDARTYYRQASEVQEALIARNGQKALASNKVPDLTLKSNLAATDTHWGMLEKAAGHLELAVKKLERGTALNEELVKAEPGNPQWVDNVAPNYRLMGEILDQLNRSEDARGYYEKFFDAKRTLAFRGLGPPQAQRELALAAKLFGDHSTGLAQIDAYRMATRVFGRMIDDPTAADWAADQFDLVSTLAGVFDAKKDWPDTQSAYRVAMKIAVLNYVKDTSATSWRDKAEEAERASVVAGKAAETTAADPAR